MYGLHEEAACGCNVGASLWIEAWFGDCVYTSWELTAFYIGLSSLLFWLVAQVPQFISNWRLQSAEALSPWFLFQWLAGDSFNFLGCILTGDQLATQNVSASYYMFADFMIISQYIYYQPGKEENEELLCSGEADAKAKESVSVVVYTTANLPTGLSGLVEIKGIEDSTNPTIHSGQSKGWLGHLAKFQLGERTLLLLNQAHDLEVHCQSRDVLTSDDCPSPSMSRQLRQVIMQYGLEYGPPTGPRLRIHHGPLRKHGNSKNYRLAGAAVVGAAGLLCLGTVTCQLGLGNQAAITSIGLTVGRKLMTACEDTKRFWWLKDSGTTLGWASAALYLGSRVSQVVKNNERGSAEGLSLAMVSCAVMANLTYGVSILMRLYSWQDFAAKAPWLMGSLGTVSLDITLLLQARYLDRYSKSRRDKLNEYTPLLA